LIRERYFEEFLDYFENAQLSCNEDLNESEEKDDKKKVTPSDLKKIEFIADYIEGVSDSYLNKQNYKPCFVSVQAGYNKFYIVIIVTDKKYTMDQYQSFLEKKLSKTFKGMDIFVLTIDNKYDDDDSIRKSCEEHYNHISKLPNTITIEF
jgi:predicted GTPase